MENLKENRKINFCDFSDAEVTNYDLIPKGTIAKVNLKIKPGGNNDKSLGLTNNYATRSDATDSIYLNCEYTILAGEYIGRKIWSLIGLYSPRNDNYWGDIGRGFIRAILNSSSGFADNDNSPEAIKARQINNLADLDGIEFIARIDVADDDKYGKKNVIRTAITPEHKSYNLVMKQAASNDLTINDLVINEDRGSDE